MEHYTSILTVGHHELEKFYERDIILADRYTVKGTPSMYNDLIFVSDGFYVYTASL